MSTNLTILTPSVRPNGLGIVDLGLSRQSIEKFEWLICMPERFVEDGKKQIGLNEPTFITTPPLKEGMFWDLNSAYNRLIKRAKGDLIISIQDNTFFSPEALEKFAFYYDKDLCSIVSGMGDKYDRVYPTLGKKEWSDPRWETTKSFREVAPALIEGNFCAVPRQAFFDVGGFDENLDFMGYGLDFYSVFDRIAIKGGYKFYIDDFNESFSLTHGRVKDWDEKNITAEQYRVRREDYLKNPVLPFLS